MQILLKVMMKDLSVLYVNKEIEETTLVVFYRIVNDDVTDYFNRFMV